MSRMVSPVRPAAWLRPGDAGCAVRSPPAVGRLAVADELIVLLLRDACPPAGALQQLRERDGCDAGQAGSGERGTRKTGSVDRLTRPGPAARKTRTGQDDGFRTALLTRPRCVQLFLEGVLNFRPGHLGIALNLITAPFGLQARAAGGAAGGLLEAAFNCFGLVRDLLGDTHRDCLSKVIPQARGR